MSPVIDNLDLFWSGFLQSLEFIVYALIGSMVLGTVLAAFRVSPIPALRAFGTAYVTFVRNCPLTIVLFFMAFGLPEVGINRSFFFFGVAGLVIYTAAFVCEALRSGINSVDAGQAEAARAVGLTFTQTMGSVVLPQAFRAAVPPLGSRADRDVQELRGRGRLRHRRRPVERRQDAHQRAGAGVHPDPHRRGDRLPDHHAERRRGPRPHRAEGGDRPMSAQSVLYDVPGPRARRRARIGTAVALLGIAVLVGGATLRLADEGQFSSELWGPLIDPSTEEFADVWTLIGKGLANTLLAAALSITLSLVVGVLLGVARMMSGPVGKVPVVGFTELFRGLPVVVTIVFVWRAMVELDIPVGVLPGEDALWYLVIGLTLYNSVIIAEILRAGVASLPRGQGEAARAVGMTERQVMSTVLLPQAFRTMLPALISQLVVVLKDTSLVAVIGLGYLELLKRGNLISQNLDNPIQVLFVVGLIYIAINYSLSRFAVWLEKRLSRASTSSGAETHVEEQAPAATGA